MGDFKLGGARSSNEKIGRLRMTKREKLLDTFVKVRQIGKSVTQ